MYLGIGLTSWLSFVVSYCEFVTFPLVSWLRCGTWLYRFLIFAPLLTFQSSFRGSESWLLCYYCLTDDCYCNCPVAFPHCAFVWSAVCDCGISWSHLLFKVLSSILSTRQLKQRNNGTDQTAWKPISCFEIILLSMLKSVGLIILLMKLKRNALIALPSMLNRAALIILITKLKSNALIA